MEYGVTQKGFIMKRFDVILSEIQADISGAVGFDVSQNPQSLLNSALIIPFADKIAELWEELQDSYYAKYVSTAEGINLDNACQYGNVFRKGNRPTEYIVHVRARDGTILPEGSLISSVTNPVVRLKCATETKTERASCNNICIKPVVTSAGTYTIELNAKLYSYTAEADTTAQTILEGLEAAFSAEGYSVSVDAEKGLMEIIDQTVSRANEYALTNNLTTDWVECCVYYVTEDYGDIQCPNGSITKVTSNVTGLISVINRIAPTPGRLQQSDISLRQEYTRKTYSTSSAQTYSIESYLMENVANVRSVRCYENQNNVEDEYGRPPHCIEAIVDGGDDYRVAEGILKKKSGGILSYGDVTIQVAGEYGDVVPVSFRRPEKVYAWIRVEITNGNIAIDPNYVRLVQETLAEAASELSIGDGFYSQRYINAIYDVLPTMAYCKVTLASSTDGAQKPEEYKEGNITITQRQMIIVEPSRIEVELAE